MDANELDKVLRGPEPLPNSTVEEDKSEAVGDQQAAPALRGEMPVGSAQPPVEPSTSEERGRPARMERHKRSLDSQAEMPPLAPAFRRPALTANYAVNYDSLRSLTNFHIVAPYLLRGGQPTAEDLTKLKMAGVRTVIDLRNEEVLVRQEAMQARTLGLSFVSIPLDVFNPPSEQAVQAFMRAVGDGANQPVYVHCLHGQDRTGTMIAIYRIEHDGWNPNQAYQEMLSCGFRPGFTQLTRAVFAAGARAGRPGMPPSGGDIVTDMQNRFSRSR
jgi:protein tyrosine phosphatase (PTP) superfamily phosphohydrolase (DUF442 family)